MRKKSIITVFHVRDLGKTSRNLGNFTFRWIYLGQDIKHKQAITQVLGEENRYILGNLLQEIAHQEKQPFLDFLAELGRQQKNKLRWWASYITYRSHLASDFFLHWCYTSLLDKVVSIVLQDDKQQLIVLVEDQWLYRHLWKRYKENRDKFFFPSSKHTYVPILKLTIKGLLARGHLFLKVLFRMLEFERIDSVQKLKNVERMRKHVYIYSWILNSSFQPDGTFTDVYFGRLPDILTKANYKIAYIVPPFMTKLIRKKLTNNSSYEFTSLDQYIRVSDLIKGIISVFQLSYNEKSQRLSTLLKRQVMYEFSSLPVAMLYYFALKRWLQEINHANIAIIYPFENQPWEKMLCIAATEIDRSIKLIAYQHSTIATMSLSYFLGNGESKDMPLPHIIFANGDYSLKQLRSTHTEKTKLLNGGAFRYEHFHKADNKAFSIKNAIKTILVAMPSSRVLTHELLVTILENFGDFMEEKGIRIAIKFHPTVSRDSLGIEFSNFPSHIYEADRPMENLLREVNLVVYTSSSAGLEAFLSGIPVIRYYSETILDIDPLDTCNDTIVKSCSSHNLKQVVLSVLDTYSDDSSFQHEHNRRLSEFFSPVNEDVWIQALHS